MEQELHKGNFNLVSVLEGTLEDKKIMGQVKKLTSDRTFSDFLAYNSIAIYSEPFGESLHSKQLLIRRDGFAKCHANYEDDGEAGDAGLGVVFIAGPILAAGQYFINSPNISGKVLGGALLGAGALACWGFTEHEINSWYSNFKRISCKEVSKEFPSLDTRKYRAGLEFYLARENKNFENYQKYNILPTDNFLMRFLAKKGLIGTRKEYEVIRQE